MDSRTISKGEREQKFLDIKENKSYILTPWEHRILNENAAKEKVFYNKERERCRETGSRLIVICRKAVYNRNRQQGFWNMQSFREVVY